MQRSYIGSSDNTAALGIYRDSNNYIQLNIELGYNPPHIAVHRYKNGNHENMGRVNLT